MTCVNAARRCGAGDVWTRRRLPVGDGVGRAQRLVRRFDAPGDRLVIPHRQRASQVRPVPSRTISVRPSTPTSSRSSTMCRRSSTISGEVSLSLGMKDVTTSPTTNNAITINRYHVRFVRADGRNTPGVDVPYAFDGAFTGTVRPGGNLTATFELVRHIAKTEAPLGNSGSQPGDHLDHRRNHLLRTRSDRPRCVGDGADARVLWQLRGSGLGHR